MNSRPTPPISVAKPPENRRRSFEWLSVPSIISSLASRVEKIVVHREEKMIDLGDARLNKRFTLILGGFAQAPVASIPLDRPPRGLMTRPTTREVLQHLSHAMVLRVDEGPRRLQFPADYQNGFDQILRWTGINPSVFLVPHVRPAHRRIPTVPPETAETPIHAPPSSTESPQDKGGSHGSVI